MGMYDTVLVPCPKCGEKYPAQSKGGKCELDTYELHNAPAEVMSNVNRHAPFTCSECGTQFEVKYRVEVHNVFVVPIDNNY